MKTVYRTVGPSRRRAMDQEPGDSLSLSTAIAAIAHVMDRCDDKVGLVTGLSRLLDKFQDAGPDEGEMPPRGQAGDRRLRGGARAMDSATGPDLFERWGLRRPSTSRSFLDR